MLDKLYKRYKMELNVRIVIKINNILKRTGRRREQNEILSLRTPQFSQGINTTIHFLESMFDFRVRDPLH